VTGFEILLRYFHAGYLWLIAPLLPPVDSIWTHVPGDVFLNPFPGQVVTARGWFEFVSQAQVYRTLFLLKLPYLFFDLGCAFLLFRLGSDRAQSKLMLGFWWLNPVLIFAVYIFGRHEVIALFFVILSLYLIRQERPNGGLLALGVAIALRYYAMLLLPFVVLSMTPSWKKRVVGLLIGLSPWLVQNLIGWLTAGAIEAGGLASLPNSSYLLSMRLKLAALDNLYIFPLAYFLLALHRLYNKEYGWRTILNYSLIVLLLLFATAQTGASPHYWTWLLPLLTLGVAEDRRLLPLHAAQVGCLVVYSFTGGRGTGSLLVAPIAPDFFWSLPTPVDLISRYASAEMVISLARTALSAVTLWMVYLCLRRMGASVPVEH
jgi:hypothetical protein